MEAAAPILGVANRHPYLSVVSVALGCAAIARFARRRPRSDLPPGPKGYPLVGNLFDFLPTHVWERFSEFGKQYGASSPQPSHSIFTFARTDAPGCVRRRNHVSECH